MTMQNYITPVSRVENGNGLKFVIFDAPNDNNIHLYIKVTTANFDVVDSEDAFNLFDAVLCD
jgi:hypothetical protein